MKTKRHLINKRKRTTRKRTTRNRAKKQRGRGMMFASIIKNAFKIIAEENGWSDYDVAADEYLIFLKNIPVSEINTYLSMLKDETTMVGGGFEFGKYLNIVLVAVIGKFDTPCNKILSNLAFVLYCVMITSFVKSYKKHGNMNDALADDEYAHSLADPVQYILYNNFKFLYNFQEQVFAVFRTCAQKVFEQINLPAESSAGLIAIAIRSALYNPQLYKTFIVGPLACILKPVIITCEEYCF
jgi:hypothetical protein